MRYPTSVDLLEFFGSEPDIQGDVSAYTVSDEDGASLVMSFNTADDSLQTTLLLRERAIAVVCHEGMTRMAFNEDTLACEFVHDDTRVMLTAKVKPNIRVEWSGLRTG